MSCRSAKKTISSDIASNYRNEIPHPLISYVKGENKLKENFSPAAGWKQGVPPRRPRVLQGVGRMGVDCAREESRAKIEMTEKMQSK